MVLSLWLVSCTSISGETRNPTSQASKTLPAATPTSRLLGNLSSQTPTPLCGITAKGVENLTAGDVTIEVKGRELRFSLRGDTVTITEVEGQKLLDIPIGLTPFTDVYPFYIETQDDNTVCRTGFMFFRSTEGNVYMEVME